MGVFFWGGGLSCSSCCQCSLKILCFLKMLKKKLHDSSEVELECICKSQKVICKLTPFANGLVLVSPFANGVSFHTTFNIQIKALGHLARGPEHYSKTLKIIFKQGIAASFYDFICEYRILAIKHRMSVVRVFVFFFFWKPERFVNNSLVGCSKSWFKVFISIMYYSNIKIIIPTPLPSYLPTFLPSPDPALPLLHIPSVAPLPLPATIFLVNDAIYHDQYCQDGLSTPHTTLLRGDHSTRRLTRYSLTFRRPGKVLRTPSPP